MKQCLITRNALFLTLLLLLLNASCSQNNQNNDKSAINESNRLASSADSQEKELSLTKGIPCSAGAMPDISEDLEGWAEWMEECSAGDTGDGNPWPCNRGTFTSQDGKCWRVVCEGRGFSIEPCKPLPSPMGPRLDSVMVRKGEFSVHITTEKGRSEQKISRDKVKLVHLLSAMIHGSTLPSGEIGEIPISFWTSQKSVTLK